ncbi:hypothetical protein L2E82_27099 [Cichorium intybus]|uniref:Uncharacterized protein n=1 Tax=Cichorium intybus TaxID=13427 RepID=A0ACB9CS20_CICIN|nr:hypothetical protein L2E82_27099 [Cichorium intybus]
MVNHGQEKQIKLQSLKFDYGRIASRTGSLPPESNSLSSSGGGSRTTHKNLCSLLSNPIAISFRIEYYATVAEPSCELQFAPSGLGYCDVAPGFGVEAPYSELINIHYTARLKKCKSYRFINSGETAAAEAEEAKDDPGCLKNGIGL